MTAVISLTRPSQFVDVKGKGHMNTPNDGSENMSIITPQTLHLEEKLASLNISAHVSMNASDGSYALRTAATSPCRSNRSSLTNLEEWRQTAECSYGGKLDLHGQRKITEAGIESSSAG